MLPRRLSTRVNHLLSHSPAVVLLGPRQVGKTALALEIGATPPSVCGTQHYRTLWVRGGFPRSFLADNDALSMEWRRNFIRTYLERDVPQFGSRIPAETLRRFWTMLAHKQAQMLNEPIWHAR